MATNNYCIDSHSEPLIGCVRQSSIFGRGVCSRFFSVITSTTIWASLFQLSVLFSDHLLHRVLCKRIQMPKVSTSWTFMCAINWSLRKQMVVVCVPLTCCYPLILRFYYCVYAWAHRSQMTISKIDFHLPPLHMFQESNWGHWICTKALSHAELSCRPATVS